MFGSCLLYLCISILPWPLILLEGRALTDADLPAVGGLVTGWWWSGRLYRRPYRSLLGLDFEPSCFSEDIGKLVEFEPGLAIEVVQGWKDR